MKYKALISFAGKVSMRMGEVRELTDKPIIDDLLKAKYIVADDENNGEEVKEEVQTTEEVHEAKEEIQEVKEEVQEVEEPKKETKRKKVTEK